MAISFGQRLFISPEDLEAGHLIEFGYNGTVRVGVVVTPVWKMNCDCYVFDDLDNVSDELLERVGFGEGRQFFQPGDLYNEFRNQYTFKSFKLDNMDAIQNIEFDIYNEQDELPPSIQKIFGEE